MNDLKKYLEKNDLLNDFNKEIINDEKKGYDYLFWFWSEHNTTTHFLGAFQLSESLKGFTFWTHVYIDYGHYLKLKHELTQLNISL